MKNRKVNVRLSSGLLLILFLGQSCRVYQSSTISLDDAINSKTSQFKKVRTSEKEIYHFRRIELIEGKIFGSGSKKGKLILTRITISNIESIQLQNIEKSNLRISLAIFIPTVLIILGTILYINAMSDFGSWGLQFPM